MLTDRGFQALLARQGASKRAIDVVQRVRKGLPDRAVEAGSGHRAGRIASSKMGFTLGSESGVESIAMLFYQLDPEVLEHYDQPLQLKLPYTDKNGRARGLRYHPDALVLERRGVYLDEWKTEEQLLELARDMPDRYVRDVDGWRSPMAEVAARELGLTYRVRTLANVPGEILANGKFLRDYLAGSNVRDEDAARRVIETVAAAPGLTIASLLARLGIEHADELYRAIARREIYVDLAKQRLADSFYTRVYPSAVLASAIEMVKHPWADTGLKGGGSVVLEPGASVDWSGKRWLIVGATERVIQLRATDGALLPLARPEAEGAIREGVMRAALDGPTDAMTSGLRRASPPALAQAQFRFRTLQRFWDTHLVEVPERTLRNWNRRFEESEQKTGFGFLGLIPGRRGRKAGARTLDPAVEALVHDAISTFYRTPDAPTATALHGKIQAACEDAGLAAPSYATVLERVGDVDRHALAGDRGGAKVAQQVEEYNFYLESESPRHGERPWERAHADHTLVDVELVDSETGLALGRPWLSLLIDAYSRRVLAYWLTFDEPSYRSLLMLVRRCAKRWGRLPEEWVVDGGVEFGSSVFERLLALYRLDKKVRLGEPRIGAVLERLFGSLNTRLFHLLRGNSKPMRNVRQVTVKTAPSIRAVWTLAELYELLDEFFFEIYDNLQHPALGASPKEFYDARLAMTGLRESRLVADDETLFMATLPTTPSGQAKIDYRRGVKILGRYYRASEFRLPGVYGKSAPVRYDPMDVRHAYVFVRGNWVEAWCGELRRFPAISERAVMAISAELDERRRTKNRTAAVDAITLARFIAKAKDTESAPKQFRFDAELRQATANSDGREAEVPEAPAPLDSHTTEPAPTSAPMPPTTSIEIYEAYE